jgi:hypothetical protein
VLSTRNVVEKSYRIYADTNGDRFRTDWTLRNDEGYLEVRGHEISRTAAFVQDGQVYISNPLATLLKLCTGRWDAPASMRLLKWTNGAHYWRISLDTLADAEKWDSKFAGRSDRERRVSQRNAEIREFLFGLMAGN